ncbi:unnamed protein product [Mytilus edulis]|uniref:B box-type domain-containing protein n=1 Tax=Mytilus edulis TaxID=6550 RepID=A0A8S3PUY8_MYTED|nr:unnamed protein product [Mytilus edulis]
MAQISAKTCELCTEQSGVFYCYECQHALCGLCRSKHDKISSTRGHTVTSIQNVDLANFNTRLQCVSHERDFLFNCAKCSVLICSKCVTTTHKDHSFSEIEEMVSKERELATDILLQLKAKIENILDLKENVKCNHLSKLEKRNISHIDKQYSRVSSELENILLEKHDITFFMCNTKLQGDIKCLYNVPDSPKCVQIEPFEKSLFYKDVVAYIQSKAGESICQYCADKQTTVERIQKEQNACEEKLNGAMERDKEEKILIKKINTLEIKVEEMKYVQNILDD